MTDRQLPTPRTATDAYLAAIHDRLGELLDRFPAPAPAGREDGSVELREPAVSGEPAASAPAGGAEGPPPKTDGGGEGPGAVGVRRPARTSTTKTTARTTAKSAGKTAGGTAGAKTARKRTPKPPKENT